MRLAIGALLSVIVLLAAARAAVGPPSGQGSYDDFINLWDEFLEFRAPSAWNPNFNDPHAPNHGLIDYSRPAIKKRLKTLEAMRARLDDMNVAEWPRARQSEWLAVRAEFEGQEFLMRVSRPWARDPGFYVDQLQRFGFTELPLEGDALAKFERELAAVPALVAGAKEALTEPAKDYAALALRNLVSADGVGHGQPFRATPPAGVVGWYEDLLGQAKAKQPALASKVEAALAATREFRDWLKANEPKFKGKAGVGADRYDWYLKHALLMPYTSDELIRLSDREWERLTAFYGLARHRNRNLPELKPASNAKEYAKRLAATDRNIRAFLTREAILTIPSYVGALDTNVPFIERPEGLNFWEAVQFRDPHPDHLHAVIPGHRFDQVIEDNNRHRVRGRISDSARVEGWGVYLEEGMMQAGVLGDRRRVDELIYLFGIFRAARVPADVKMQRNEMSVAEAVAFMREATPWLDEDVARVDAEIYIRRPPGYGIGYTIGNLQMQALLADRRRQLGEDFNLTAFHDEFLSLGRLPMSLLRWEMTGLDDEVREFWAAEPMPGAR